MLLPLSASMYSSLKGPRIQESSDRMDRPLRDEDIFFFFLFCRAGIVVTLGLVGGCSSISVRFHLQTIPRKKRPASLSTTSGLIYTHFGHVGPPLPRLLSRIVVCLSLSPPGLRSTWIFAYCSHRKLAAAFVPCYLAPPTRQNSVRFVPGQQVSLIHSCNPETAAGFQAACGEPLARYTTPPGLAGLLSRETGDPDSLLYVIVAYDIWFVGCWVLCVCKLASSDGVPLPFSYPSIITIGSTMGLARRGLLMIRGIVYTLFSFRCSSDISLSGLGHDRPNTYSTSVSFN